MFDMIQNGVPFALAVLGLGATAFGAWIASQGAIISKEDAIDFAGSKWGPIEFERSRFAQALYRQGQDIKRGLMWVFGGTLFQIGALVLERILAS